MYILFNPVPLCVTPDELILLIVIPDAESTPAAAKPSFWAPVPLNW
jgi:hypothetical protein